MARKLRGNTTIDMVADGISERNSFKPKIGTTTTISDVNTGLKDPAYENKAKEPVPRTGISESYNKMVGSYNTPVNDLISQYKSNVPTASSGENDIGAGGFYKSMSGLEGASMRLANAASQRSMSEAAFGSGLKRGELAQEYAMKGGLMGEDYGMKGNLMGQEYGLQGNLMGQEYGLKGNLIDKQNTAADSQLARSQGYSSPEAMYGDIRLNKQMNDMGYVKSGGRWVKQK